MISNFLIHNNTITKLNLSKTIITNNGTKYLSEVIKYNTTLSSLNLSECFIDCSKDINLNVLYEALQTKYSLTKLNSSNNKLGSKEYMQLSNVLKVNTTLTNLNLKNISLYVKLDVFKLFYEVLKTNYSLTKLNLSISDYIYHASMIILDKYDKDDEYI